MKHVLDLIRSERRKIINCVTEKLSLLSMRYVDYNYGLSAAKPLLTHGFLKREISLSINLTLEWPYILFIS